jgi:hypothetical protein
MNLRRKSRIIVYRIAAIFPVKVLFQPTGKKKFNTGIRVLSDYFPQLAPGLAFIEAGLFVRAEPYIVGDEECAGSIITIPSSFAISKKTLFYIKKID